MTQTNRSEDWGAPWEKLVKDTAQEWADQDNEAESHCGPYGTRTYEDYMIEAREYLEYVGNMYWVYWLNNKKEKTPDVPDADQLSLGL